MSHCKDSVYKRRVKAESFVNNCIEVGQGSHKLVPGWVGGGESREKFIAKFPLLLGKTGEFDKCPL